MNEQSFFGTVIEEVWKNIQLTPAPRRRFALTGHFRLDAALLRAVWVPHAIIATLRDPIKRLLSHYNFSRLVPGNPHHEALRVGRMSFLEYAEWLIARNSIGPQYSFFDDTGAGTFAYSGYAPPEKCLDNLLNRAVCSASPTASKNFASCSATSCGDPISSSHLAMKLPV